MLGTSIASFIFIMSSSIFGMPISATHAVVGALIGAGIATSNDASGINWSKFGVIVGSWFVAPAVSICLSLLLFFAVSHLTLNVTRWNFSQRLNWQQLISGFASILIFQVVRALVSGGSTKEDEEETTDSAAVILTV